MSLISSSNVYKSLALVPYAYTKQGKGIYYCPIEIIKGLTDKGQFQYLTKLNDPQFGNYLYTTQFLSLR